jgi:hypothetical protein
MRIRHYRLSIVKIRDRDLRESENLHSSNPTGLIRNQAS